MNEPAIRKMIETFGEYKKVVNAKTGIAYKIPTRDILIKGIKGWELDKYPLWEK